MRAQISQHAHRITCWSPLWGAGPLSGALLGDGASWSAPLPCKTTPTCLGTVRHLYRRPCIWGSGGVRSRRRPGAAGQVETQAAGRSSCSAVSTRPVVPGDRGVHGWDSFLLPVRAGTNPCCNCGTFRLQTPFSFEVRTWFKASPCRSVPFLGSRAVVPLSESFQISFAMCTLHVAFKNQDARCAAGAPYSTRAVVVAEGPALPEPPPPTT